MSLPDVRIIYPDRRTVSAAAIIRWAQDHLATEYMRRNPGADPAAVDANSRIRHDEFGLADAIDILDDAGAVTFAFPMTEGGGA